MTFAAVFWSLESRLTRSFIGRQGFSDLRSCGMVLLVFTCELSPRPACISQLRSSCTAGSLSLLSATNGASFGVILPTGGPYGFVVISSPTKETLANVSRSIDLLPYTRGRSFGRDPQPCWYRCYDPNQLSGAGRVPCLTFYTRLTGHNVKIWVSFVVVSTPSRAFPSQRRECFATYCHIFPRSSCTCRQQPLRYCLSSACTSSPSLLCYDNFPVCQHRNLEWK
jgi:hypothetical protein